MLCSQCIFVPVHHMKAYGGIMLYFVSFTSFTLDAYILTSLMLRPIYSRCQRPQYRFKIVWIDLTSRVNVSKTLPLTLPRIVFLDHPIHSAVTIPTGLPTTQSPLCESQIVKSSVTLTIESHKIVRYLIKFDSHVSITAVRKNV